MSIAKDLFHIANELSPYTEFKFDEIEALIEAANDIGKSWSGSPIGYHSRVYYRGFINPPLGARFSPHWGLRNSQVTKGDWTEFNFDDVVSTVCEKAGNPDLEKILAQSNEAEEAFEQAKSSVLSLIHSNFEEGGDKFFKGLIEKIEASKVIDESDFIQYYKPAGQFVSHDVAAVEKGIFTPPHLVVLAKALAL